MSKFVKLIALVLIVGAIFLIPAQSYARDHWDHDRDYDRDYSWGHNYYGYHGHSDYGFRLSVIPRSTFTVSLGRSRYYYSDGVYYQPYNREYILVQPPIGAIVRQIPSAYQAVNINGVTYYTDNGTYYAYTPSGYQVVPAPVSYVQAPMTIVQQVPVAVQSAPVVSQPATGVVMGSDDSYTVNIPNEKAGGYTAVTLKRANRGYVGPQGEFYNDFPTVNQLKAMYVK